MQPLVLAYRHPVRGLGFRLSPGGAQLAPQRPGAGGRLARSWRYPLDLSMEMEDTAEMDGLYVIERARDGEVSYWRGDAIWVTDLNDALRIGGYNVAVPIAGVLSMICDGRVDAKAAPAKPELWNLSR